MLAGCLVAALAGGRRGALFATPWGWPAVACAVAWVVGAAASGDVREGLGHAWLLAPLLVVPALAPGARGRFVEVGLWAAAAAGAWGVAQAARGADGTANFSHHLTLAYALLPPLGVAVARGAWGPAAAMVAGVLSTRSEGAVVALAVTLIAARSGRPLLSLGGGVVATIALLAFAADAEELRQRALLWTGGLAVGNAGPVGPGAYAAASAPAYDALSPGFWFPNHAHDSAVQLYAVLGPGALAMHAWLCVRALRHGEVGAAAGLAGVLVGALTQDVLGDLEVARAAWIWVGMGMGAASPSASGAASASMAGAR